MRIVETLKNSFIAGVAVFAPLAITVFVLQILFNWLLGIVDPVVAGTRLTQYTANIEVVAQVLAGVLIVAFLVLLGYVADKSVGERFFGGFDRLVSLFPLARTIYTSVQQVASALMNRGTRYESVVLVEYPREGVYSFGFVTAESHPTVSAVAGDTVNVFLPNSPNPTAGRLVVVPSEDVYSIEMNVRQGIRTLVTTGMAAEEEEMAAIEAELEEQSHAPDA